MKSQRIFAVSLILVMQFAECAVSADLPAAKLLHGISNVAAGLASRDDQKGKLQDAAIWRQWSSFYSLQSRLMPAQIQASQLAAVEVLGMAQMSINLKAQGNHHAAGFYAAAARMWKDMADQIARRGDVIVHFPDEFISPIPGAPGTPWVRTRSAAVAARQEDTARLRALLQQMAIQQRQVTAQRQPALFGGSVDQMISRLNSMNQGEVDSIMNRGHWLDAFTPYWLKNAPGGNVLAQFGIGNGLMGTLGTTNISRIFNPAELAAIQSRLRMAQILGGLSAGQAEQNRIYNQVYKNQNLAQADKDHLEAMRQLYAIIARTGLDLN